MIALGIVIVIAKSSADERLNAQRGKISAGDKLHLHLLDIVTAFDCAVNAVQRAGDRSNIGEDRVLLLYLAIEGIGVQSCRTVIVSFTGIISLTEKSKVRR